MTFGHSNGQSWMSDNQTLNSQRVNGPFRWPDRIYVVYLYIILYEYVCESVTLCSHGHTLVRKREDSNVCVGCGVRERERERESQ